jgi:hypothetical protein
MSRKFLARLYSHAHLVLPLLLIWMRCSDDGM